MNRERLFWIVVLIAVLVSSTLLGQRAWQGSASNSEFDADSFRTWFWNSRTLDLVVQVGLILGGALGIAALLPGERKDE